jgi:hypothetical protein
MNVKRSEAKFVAGGEKRLRNVGSVESEQKEIEHLEEVAARYAQNLAIFDDAGAPLIGSILSKKNLYFPPDWRRSRGKCI